MKKIISILGLSLIVSTAILANDIVLNDSVEAIKLFDGRRIDPRSEVDRAHVVDKNIEFLELKTGEIVDRSDIVSLKFSQGHNLLMRVMGVDGGG